MATISASNVASQPGRVMIVDDDVTACHILKSLLTRQGHEVIVTTTAEQAQEKLQSAGLHTFDAVVTDYHLPQQNGLDLLRWVLHREEALAVILITAESQKSLVTQTLRSGACDFLEKPIRPRDLNPAVERAMHRTRERRRLKTAQAAVKDVGQFQQFLLHAGEKQHRLAIELCFHPHYEAGGDFLNCFEIGPDRHAILLTDVSGHDLRAAFLSAYFQGLVRGMLECNASVAEIFDYFNAVLTQEWNCGKALSKNCISASIAATALVIDTNRNQAVVLTGGAPLPRYFDAQGGGRLIGEHTSAALGWFPDTNFASTEISIQAGGSFVLWSDGLESLADRLELPPCAVAAALILAQRGVRPMPDLNGADDDILVACIPLTSESDELKGFLPVLITRYHGGQAGEVDALESCWRAAMCFCVPDLTEPDLYNVLLATREAVLNALKHGCGADPTRFAAFSISYRPGDGLLRVVVSDPGSGHDFDFEHHEQVAATELIDVHRGLMLMRHLSTNLQILRDGAEVRMDFAPLYQTLTEDLQPECTV